MKKPVELLITAIERDMLLQPRATLHRDWIEEYAADMLSGAQMPPVVVFTDGARNWLGDGFHRTHAAEAAGLKTILADVRKGTRRDALLFSVSANADHGHRRTNEDKRRAIDIMLEDPEWLNWSDVEIARRCAVAPNTVGNRRRELSSQIATMDTRLASRGGTTYPMRLPERAPANDEQNVEPTVQPVEPYDWEAGKLRDRAMNAIRTLAELPLPTEVIAAWLKSNSYGEPFATIVTARHWLNEFAPLYREAEPGRWARVQQASRGTSDAAE